MSSTGEDAQHFSDTEMQAPLEPNRFDVPIGMQEWLREMERKQEDRQNRLLGGIEAVLNSLKEVIKSGSRSSSDRTEMDQQSSHMPTNEPTTNDVLLTYNGDNDPRRLTPSARRNVMPVDELNPVARSPGPISYAKEAEQSSSLGTDFATQLRSLVENAPTPPTKPTFNEHFIVIIKQFVYFKMNKKPLSGKTKRMKKEQQDEELNRTNTKIHSLISSTVEFSSTASRSFRREKAKRKRHIRSGLGKYVSKWFAFDRMRFLLNKDKPQTTIEIDNVVIKEEEVYNDLGVIDNDLEMSQDDEIASFVTDTQTPSVNVPSPSPLEKKHKRTRTDSTQLEEMYQTMKPSFNTSPLDAASVYGLYVANKLRGYNKNTQIEVEHAINNILYNADRGLYDSASSNVNSECINKESTHYPAENTVAFPSTVSPESSSSNTSVSSNACCNPHSMPHTVGYNNT
ncbi:hypothetical protein RN001_001963 [Aquatica leii]|uniref:Uncharacterized protein n=1 Tax=Aquatica leii TaxID=1421715 RepID=A0AAN7SJV2_9COLE|nr:hypothetical protein RN001_001963 [Aquatica leii]